MEAFQAQAALKEKIRTHQSVLGIFVKTPAMHIVEVLANVSFDFIVLDAEHAPFSIDNLDRCLVAARGNNLPALVRVADLSPTEILKVLDLGAAGILVPHIKSADTATAAIAAARYQSGDRGFSVSHRSGGYGAMPAKEYIKASDQATIVIGQIEDVEAVENIDEITAVSELDALFIGPADMTVSYGLENWNDPIVEKAIDKLCHSANQAGRAVGMFQSGTDQVPRYREKGISLFTISTDQALLMNAARKIHEDFNAV